jgi:hypothetical protein
MEKKVINMNSKTYDGNLVGILPLGVDAKHKFTPKYYSNLPKEYKLLLFISPLTMSLKREWSRLNRKIYLEELERISKNSEVSTYDDSDEYDLREVIRKSIKGWENFKTANGDTIIFELDKEGFLKKELFDLFPNDVVGDLTEELSVISCLSKAEHLGLD